MRSLWTVTIVMLSLVAFSGIAGAETITLIYSNNMSDRTANVEEDLIALFEAENPGIKVEYRNMPISPEQLLLWAAAGIGPDVFMVHSHTFYELLSLGLLEPLNLYIEKDPGFDLSDLVPESVQEFSSDGVLYAVPYEYHIVAALFYNRDAFAQSGVSEPPAEWNWRDFLSDARKLVRTSAEGVERWAYHSYHPVNFIYSWGGAITDDWQRPTRTLIDSPQSIAGLQAFIDLTTDGLAPPPHEMSYTSGFAGGQLAMTLSGLWGAYAFADVDFSWDITLPPLGEGASGGRGYEFVNRAIGMSPQTEHKEAAYKLLRFLAYDDRVLAARVLSMQDTGYQGDIPARISVAMGEAFADNDLGPVNKRLLLQVAQDVYHQPRHPSAREIWSIANNITYQVLAAGEPLGTAVENAARRIQAILDTQQ